MPESFLAIEPRQSVVSGATACSGRSVVCSTVNVNDFSPDINAEVKSSGTELPRYRNIRRAPFKAEA